MAKPRLVKVRALFYVLQQVMKRGCIGILIHPPACFFPKRLFQILKVSTCRDAPQVRPLKRLIQPQGKKKDKAGRGYSPKLGR